jgi:hypothetical protein
MKIKPDSKVTPVVSINHKALINFKSVVELETKRKEELSTILSIQLQIMHFVKN